MCSGEYSALTQLDPSRLYSVLELSYDPSEKFAILNAYEDVSKSGSLSHSDAIKIHSFFLSKNLEKNMHYYRCTFDRLEEIHLNFLLTNSCIKKRGHEDFSIQKVFCEHFNHFQEEEYEPLSLIKYFLGTGEITPIVNSKTEVILKIFTICNVYALTVLTEKLLSLMPLLLHSTKCFHIGLLINKRELVHRSLENISIDLPSIKIEENSGKIEVSLNFECIQDFDEDQKKIVDKLASIIRKCQSSLRIKIDLGFTRSQFDSLVYFIKDLGKQIEYLEVSLNSLQKENIGYFNSIVILAQSLTHLHITSSENYKDEFVFNQIAIGVPPSLEYFGVDSVNHLKSSCLHEMLQTCGKNLKHFYYKAAGNFSEKLAFAFVNLCPNLEVIYLDFEKEDIDLSYETLFFLFDKCKKLKTIRLYHSIHSPPCIGDGYDLGSLNLLQEAFPERQIVINYENPFVSQTVLNEEADNFMEVIKIQGSH